MEFNISIKDIGINDKQFSSWNEENPCYGCGNCCSNVRVPVSLLPKINNEQYFGELSQFVVNPEEPMDLNDFLSSEFAEKPGVYYVVTKRGHHCLEIIGDCPGLDLIERSCNFHDKARPQGCVDSDLNSLKCISKRKK
jgi:Fe-S-cluster containining protein